MHDGFDVRFIHLPRRSYRFSIIQVKVHEKVIIIVSRCYLWLLFFRRLQLIEIDRWGGTSHLGLSLALLQWSHGWLSSSVVPDSIDVLLLEHFSLVRDIVPHPHHLRTFLSLSLLAGIVLGFIEFIVM